jgi:cytochrome P450
MIVHMSGLTPLTAVTAPDPYDYYQRLVAHAPFAFDERVNAWVAASASAVEAVLSHPALRVRPATDPIPHAMRGTAIGAAFERLARMNDGPTHRHLRHAAVTAVEAWSVDTLASIAASCAQARAQKIGASADSLNAYLHEMPAMTIATMLEIDRQRDALTWIRDFARAIAPAATPGDVERGSAAVEALHDVFSERMTEDELASSLGFLFQTYDATAGLIGQIFATIVARRTIPDDAGLDVLLAAAVRYDAPVHNTRRFAVNDVAIANCTIRKGDAVLALLAAANRDPLGAKSFTFGLGPHACPGAQMAVSIARAGVCALTENVDLSAVSMAGYQPSLNCRIPTFEISGAALRQAQGDEGSITAS